MGRAPRLQVANGIYHVAARGVRKQPIYIDPADRKAWLGTLGEVVAKHEWICHSLCQLTNHFHLLIQTPNANIAAGMHELNSEHAHWFNWRYGHRGHLFESRYWSKLVEDDTYLMRAARYIALNPVRAGLCSRADDWPWSSYAATIGRRPAIPFVTPSAILNLFSCDAAQARILYRAFVNAGAADAWS